MINWQYLILQTAETRGVGIFDLVMTAGDVVKVVLAILVFLSVISWVIIFSKLFIFRKARKESEKFLQSYQSSGNLSVVYSSTRYLRGPLAEIFRVGYEELRRAMKGKPAADNPGHPTAEPKATLDTLGVELEVVELVERALRKATSSEIARLEGSLIFLATTGSTAPFIGLFGTVWGIMNSFRGLAVQATGTTVQAVAPGIAEALIATALGLFAAIPAVIAYNYFVNKVKRFALEMDNFSAEFLNIVGRYLSRAKKEVA